MQAIRASATKNRSKSGHSRSRSFDLNPASSSSTSSTKKASYDSDYGSAFDSMSRTSSRQSLSESLVSLISNLHVTDSEQLEQLDRENVHFSLSESIIETLEIMRWEQKTAAKVDKPLERGGSPSSLASEATSNNSSKPCENRQWIRIKRPFRPSSSNLISPVTCNSADLTDCLQDDETSAKELNSSSVLDTTFDEETQDEFGYEYEVTDELDSLNTSGHLSFVRERGLSLSNTSLFSSE